MQVQRQNMLARSWFTRGANAFLYKKGRQSYDTAIRYILSHVKTIAEANAFANLSEDAQDLLATELGRLIDDENVDLLAGQISTGMVPFENGTFVEQTNL